MEYVRRLAQVDQRERRAALLDILREEEIPFIHHREKQNDHWVENIVVPIHPSDRRLVIGAHYDSVEGSTGANDNAAGVSILIKLAKKLLSVGTISADIVFFDREEYADRGSERYIETTGKENISCMINLDVCGYGDAIAVYAKGNEKNAGFARLFSEGVLKEHGVSIVDYLPNGDDTAFERVGIPNISVAILPPKDLATFEDMYVRYIKGGITPPEDEWKRLWESIEVLSTMHNADRDSVGIVSQASMDALERYLCDGLSLL